MVFLVHIFDSNFSIFSQVIPLTCIIQIPFSETTPAFDYSRKTVLLVKIHPKWVPSFCMNCTWLDAFEQKRAITHGLNCVSFVGSSTTTSLTGSVTQRCCWSTCAIVPLSLLVLCLCPDCLVVLVHSILL